MRKKVLWGIGIILGLAAIGAWSDSGNQQAASTATQTTSISRPAANTPVVNQGILNTSSVSAPTAPNGYYENTYGNEVARPYYAPSVPSGASAQCGDGTYSFSQSRRGTCSHHGGVAEWF